MSDTKLIHGVSADYWNASKVHILIAGSSFLIVFTIATIALRFYARISSHAPLWWDDWFALATVPFALLNPIYDLIQIHFGFGRHQIVMLATNVPKAQKFGLNLYIILLFYNIGLAIFKYSFLALYIRLFSVSKPLRYACYAIGTLIAMWCVACVFAIGLRCSPVEANWNPAAGKCIPLRPIFLAQSIPTITFDIVILLLPVRLILGVQMARSARFGVLIVFLLGGLVTIISIVRLASFLQASEDDIPWDYVSIGLWSAGEPITGLVCCCLPAYAPLLRRMLKGTKGAWTTASGNNSRAKSKLTSSSNTIPGRASRAYWGGGYKRFERDSDKVELTEVGDGSSAEDRERPSAGRSEYSVGHSVPDTWSEEDRIRVTQEIRVHSEAGHAR